MPDAGRKSITDKYQDATKKIDDGTPLSRKEKALVAFVRTTEVMKATGFAAAAIVFLPVTLTIRAGSYLKQQWKSAGQLPPKEPKAAPKPPQAPTL